MGNLLDQFDPKKRFDKLREEAKDLSDEQLEELHMNTKLPHIKILRAHKRFSEYLHVLYPDHFDIKTIPVEKFKHIPCLHNNPLRKRIIHCSRLKKRDSKDPVTFTDFVTLLSILNPEGKIDTKLKFAFRLYDFNKDGKICIEDMKAYVTAVTRFDENAQAEKNDKKAADSNNGGNNSNKEGVEKKGKKKKKKVTSDIEITPQEVIDQVATKSIEEITGNAADPIKLEDFAKTLLHSDFAGKYSLHLTLHSSIFDAFKKIIDKVKSKDYVDPIKDADEDEAEKNNAGKLEEVKITEEDATDKKEEGEGIAKKQQLKSGESLSATKPKPTLVKDDSAYNYADSGEEYDSQEDYESNEDYYDSNEEDGDPYGINEYGQKR
jgi:Ca2+-binding EF-hand superfamily protein